MALSVGFLLNRGSIGLGYRSFLVLDLDYMAFWWLVFVPPLSGAY